MKNQNKFDDFSKMYKTKFILLKLQNSSFFQEVAG